MGLKKKIDIHDTNVTCRTHIGSKWKIAGNKEVIWTSKSKLPAECTWLWTTLYGEGGPDHEKKNELYCLHKILTLQK